MNRHTASTPVVTAREGGVLTLTMNRPETRNPLSEAMLDALQLGLDEAADDASVRVIVLAANGPVFSAGHDLKEMTAHRQDGDRGLARYRSLFAKCSHLMQTIVRHPRPVIASVQGTATAAGCQLVASCDLAIASSEARFATPGVNIGLFCSTPMVALSRAVPRKAAMAMLLTGEMIGADEAQRLGLINRVVPADTLDRAVDELARSIAAKSPLVLKIGKEAFYRQAELSLDEAYAYTSEVMVTNMMARDAEEGIDAFLQKRAPKWENR